MWDKFWDIVAANHPVLIFGGVIVVAVAVAVWACSKFYYTRIVKAESELKDLTKEVEDLPCAKHDQTSQIILEKLNTITTYLMTKDSKASFIFSQKASPRKLNAYGNRLFEECNGQKFLDRNKEELLESISAKNPNTALDVENLAVQVLISRLDSDIFNELKQWVYNSPTWKIEIQGQPQDYTVTMNDICFVLSLPLRDMYLALHPDIE